jgi:DNA polymerase III subunit delta'
VKFADIIGHSTVKEKLAAQVNTGRLPHAMLILGPEGSGGLPMALAMAQYLVCEKRSGTIVDDGGGLFGEALPVVERPDTLDACGECPSCQKAQKWIHPDIHYTYPVINTKKAGSSGVISADFILEWRTALTDNPYLNVNQWLQQIGAENRQGNISVSECHEIIRHLNLMAYESTQKIQIIWMAEYLATYGNTLLKILEEPPAHTYFILIAESADQILNTILSRTQLIKLANIDSDELTAHLLKQYDMEAADARRIARIADGNLNAAREYAQGAGHPYDTLLQQWLSICLRLNSNAVGENAVKLSLFLDEIAGLGRENQKLFARYFLWFLREVMPLLYNMPSEKLEGGELAFANKFASTIDLTAIERLQDIMTRLHYYIERNGNAKIVFQAASMKVASVFRGEPPPPEWT